MKLQDDWMAGPNEAHQGQPARAFHASRVSEAGNQSAVKVFRLRNSRKDPDTCSRPFGLEMEDYRALASNISLIHRKT